MLIATSAMPRMPMISALASALRSAATWTERANLARRTSG
jgi:hypothetical protein